MPKKFFRLRNFSGLPGLCERCRTELSLKFLKYSPLCCMRRFPSLDGGANPTEPAESNRFGKAAHGVWLD
jgi:hypothetical protein